MSLHDLQNALQTKISKTIIPKQNSSLTADAWGK